MTTIKRVALAGASGNLGPSILTALLAAKFDVTVLTRADSKASFPSASNLTVTPVDYDSAESLTTSLRGQDALVSTLSTTNLQVQLALFDAAAAVGVKRVIPSEFGSDTTISPTKELPVFGHKIEVQKHLAELAAKNADFSYTLVITGPFFDWGLMIGFIAGLKARTAQLYDGGDRPFSATTLATIGTAVVGVLAKPEETKNKAVKVHEAVVTQNQLVDIAERLSGEKFKTTIVDTKELEGEANEALKKGDHSGMVGFIFRSIFGEGYGGEFTSVDNDLLGVKMLGEKEVEEVVAKYI